MNNAKLTIGSILAALIASTAIAVPAEPSIRQDGRLIEKLEWVSPNGELPTTLEQYLLTHPLAPARFSEPVHASIPLGPIGEGFSILVHGALYPYIAASLDGYIDDLEAEGYSVFMQTVSGGTPEEIKAWVTERYEAGSAGMVFVGDITAAWAEVSEAVFPCDFYYMDLDGYWEDADGDGDYDIHYAGNGDQGPEVYVGRIYAHTLTYAPEYIMVNDYFAKAHAYRTGELTQPWRGLEYIEEDWYTMDVHLDLVYGENIEHHDFGYRTTAADYLNQMDLGQHFVQVCVHSYSGGHAFGTRPTESAVYAHLYVHSATAREAHLNVGADDGIKIWLNGENVLTEDRYGEWTEDQWTAPVNLLKGWNRLLCKISQGGGGFQFSAGFTLTSGEPISDLTCQLDNPDTHGSQAPYICNWLLNGFHQDSWQYFWDFLMTNYLEVDEASINPQDGEMTGGKQWTAFGSPGHYMNLSAYDDHDQGVCYAFARVFAEEAMDCKLWLGYDDGARIWLNGEEILYDARYGGFILDMTKLDVTLAAGENRLLVKISERMDTHGFSARFCDADGLRVEGLSYDPGPAPVGHFGRWLLHGPYENADEETRLSTDYIGGEPDVAPSSDDVDLTWEIGDQDACPFDLVAYYDHGAWVTSQDIQDRDPPVLFYNLFACGPGLFVDQNYLAGAYIFNTTYGLITIACAKSGSMLNFQDFTRPLGEGKSIGTAYLEWFEAQAPYVLWEREWYFGMVACGDPTLKPMSSLDPADVNGDGAVDVLDLLAVLGAWGPCPDCPEDINDDGTVDVLDLLAVLANWGLSLI